MKFLCLAYGDEAGWKSLTAEQQRHALAHDTVIRERGGVMSAVRMAVTSVRNWDGRLEVSDAASTAHALPLAGFSVIEADSIDEVIALVKDTPCARARGVIEIRAMWQPESRAD